jgi:hypothetical protein
MPMIPPTDWKARADALDRDGLLVLVDGEKKPWGLAYGSDTFVGIEMVDQLDEGELLTNPVLTLERLPALGETDYLDKTSQCLPETRTVQGTMVFQRVAFLERDRCYQLKILHGEASNFRGPYMLIECR